MTARSTLRRWPLVIAFVVAALVTAACFASITVRGDLSDLLPGGQTAASRLMLDELRSGPASRLLLIGIEGAPTGQLAAISSKMADRLQGAPLFRLVNNGQQVPDEAAIALLFRYRYLLAGNVSPAAFQPAALRQDFENLLQGLQSSASPAVQQFGLPDPTGAFPAMLATLAGGARVQTVDGVWFAPDRSRALMLAQIEANGLDFEAGGRALAAVSAAFDAARTGTGTHGARLLVSGPAVFAHDAAAAIRSDVRLLSVVSALLVAGLLFWRFRSPWVVVAITIPLVIGAAAGAAAVQLVFGFVHGITLGFGMTMLGVTVDYPVLLIGHRKRAEAAPATLRRIGHAFNLAVITATLGLAGMVFARLPGLSQLGVFAASGILAAAAVTRFVLPALIVAADLAPASAGNPALLARLERWRNWRWAALGLAGAAAMLLVARGGPGWDADLGHLSPVPPRALALDAALRADLGAPETGQMLVVQGASAEAVLQREEDMDPTLKQLTDNGAIGGADDAASLLPSARTQLARRAALPAGAGLAANVAQAAAGLGFTPSAFQPFIDGVADSRTLAPLALPLPSVLAADRLLSARLGAMLAQRGDTWFGLVAPRAVHDPARLAAAFAGAPGVTFVDIHAETDRIADAYTRQARPWLVGGAAAAVISLAAGLRDPGRLLRVLGSVGAALLVTVAAWTLAGVPLSLVHVIALQFVAGIGLDYALFFSRPRLDEEERSRTLRTLFTCNAMALMTFGLLCICTTPLLRAIGETVVVGVVAAMVFAFLFAGPAPRSAAA
jgi:predicted exporter